MIIAVNIEGDLVGTVLGRALSMAVAEVEQGQITSWEEYEVRWDLSHDQIETPTGDLPAETIASHHARVASFMTEHQAEAVVTGTAGEPIVEILARLGIPVITDVHGDARQAAIAAANQVRAS